jgi:hypothetical protein
MCPNAASYEREQGTVSCTGRLLTEDRANVGDAGRGRATSCGGRHRTSCERSERSFDYPEDC